MKIICILLLGCLLISACASQKKMMDSWIGSTKANLIMSWGPPARTDDDGNGGQVLIYTRHIYAPSLNWNFWEYKMMYVNGNGIIYHWLLNRQPVPPTEVNVRLVN